LHVSVWEPSSPELALRNVRAVLRACGVDSSKAAFKSPITLRDEKKNLRLLYEFRRDVVASLKRVRYASPLPCRPSHKVMSAPYLAAASGPNARATLVFGVTTLQ
jgi:hypothetical protein